MNSLYYNNMVVICLWLLFTVCSTACIVGAAFIFLYRSVLWFYDEKWDFVSDACCWSAKKETITKLLDQIYMITFRSRQDAIVKGDTGEELELLMVPQKIIYEECTGWGHKTDTKQNKFFSLDQIRKEIFNFLSSDLTKG